MFLEIFVLFSTYSTKSHCVTIATRVATTKQHWEKSWPEDGGYKTQERCQSRQLEVPRIETKTGDFKRNVSQIVSAVGDTIKHGISAVVKACAT